ncbi:DUF262 domain-containing protein [Cloacibacterium sp.]|uniref:DUF262 domain-containing protein n=1 Tax=Cloacibacterium sp. TaxID=1913682 RepID=UPI0035B0A6BC
MKAGKYSVKELFTNRYVDQIVIPEIQRDYVWSGKEVIGLLNSISEDFFCFKKGFEIVDHTITDNEIKKAFEQYYKKQVYSCNIGFIYAYNDPEYSGKYFLIDGQQRLTTIYLLLLVLASENKNFRDKFEKIYMLSNSPVIDYRVREASHRLLKDVVTNFKDRGFQIENQSWYYNEFKNDKTISSIVSNIKTIHTFILDNALVSEDFINYIQDYIEFWYFDTNVSEQGEELYIYMNARGEQMQENENLKADLLGKIVLKVSETRTISEIKNDWGKEWEDWQHFFWIKKQKNFNADKGFNEFINCIAGLENYLGENNNIYTKEDFEGNSRGKNNQFAYLDIVNSLSNNGLQSIKGYFEGLEYLFNEKNIISFKRNYKNINWVENCLAEILKILNSTTTNWFADLKDPNRSLEHSRMVFIWSLLHYMKTKDSSTMNLEIYRVLRLYYVRYNNYNRSVQNIATDVRNVNLYGPWKVIGIEEEVKKNYWYTEKINPDEIFQFEELIWNIEDHPLNLDGRDAKAINCSHLIDFESEPSLSELENIKNKFFELFPTENGKINNVNYKRLVIILIFYGQFWERVSPWYCNNFHFGNWKKTIRNIDVQNEVFKSFFEDYRMLSLDEIYNERVVQFDIDFETVSFHDVLKWFSATLGERMWKQGLYVVTDHYNYPKNDKFFMKFKTILNTKGDFKGGEPQELSRLIKTK